MEQSLLHQKSVDPASTCSGILDLKKLVKWRTYYVILCVLLTAIQLGFMLAIAFINKQFIFNIFQLYVFTPNICIFIIGVLYYILKFLLLISSAAMDEYNNNICLCLFNTVARMIGSILIFGSMLILMSIVGFLALFLMFRYLYYHITLGRFILHRNIKPSMKYIEKIIEFCATNKYNNYFDDPTRRIIATNYYLICIFSNYYNENDIDDADILIKYITNTHNSSKTTLNQITLRNMRDNSSTLTNVLYRKYFYGSYCCLFIIQIIVTFVYRSLIQNMDIFSIICLSIYIPIEICCFILHVKFTRFGYYAMHILPFEGSKSQYKSSRALLYSLKFDEVFDDVEDMINNIKTIYNIMYGQIDETNALVDSMNNIFGKHLINIIIEYLWYPLPDSTNMDESILSFNSVYSRNYLQIELLINDSN